MSKNEQKNLIKHHSGDYTKTNAHCNSNDKQIETVKNVFHYRVKVRHWVRDVKYRKKLNNVMLVNLISLQYLIYSFRKISVAE